MGIIELFLIALALSMDAFAIAVCLGLRNKATMKNLLTVGIYFGAFHVVMPLIGYFAATAFADAIDSYDHWIAFALLSFIGIRMIIGSFNDEDHTDGGSLDHKLMLPLAVAMSIDALAVGISFAVIRIDILPAALMIGLVVLLLAMIGLKVGSVFGTKMSSKAELAGGIILIAIGTKILLEHLGIIAL